VYICYAYRKWPAFDADAIAQRAASRTLSTQAGANPALLAACKALAQLRLAMDESTFLFTSESVSEGHPGIAYND